MKAIGWYLVIVGTLLLVSLFMPASGCKWLVFIAFVLTLWIVDRVDKGKWL